MKWIRLKTLCTIASAALLWTGCTQPTQITQTDPDPEIKDETDNPPEEEIPAGSIFSLKKTDLTAVASRGVTITGAGQDGIFVQNRRISLSPYSIGKYEVTRELWVEVMSVLYDDLQQNGNFFKSEQTGKGVQRFITAIRFDPNEQGLSQWQRKAIKASKFVEYMGSDVFGVGGDEMSVSAVKDRNYLTAYHSMFMMSKEEVLDYFSEANKYKPMGYVQWHEAVVFLNYLSILSGLMPVYQLDRFMAWQIGGSKSETKFGTDLDYHWGGEAGGLAPYRGDPDKRYIRPRLYLPLQENTASRAASGFKREWRTYDINSGRPIESFALQLPAEMHPFKPIKQNITGFAKPGSAEFETALEAARRNPVSWMKDQYWLEALPSAETKPVEKADPYSGFPSKKDTQYSLRDVLKNQRITFDQSANGYRLPTEAEWEFAARGGNPNDAGAEWNSSYSGGVGIFTRDTPNPQTQVANFSGAPIDVGSLKPNRLGLYDMSGNIAEWVFDMKYGEANVFKAAQPRRMEQPEKDPIANPSDNPSRDNWSALERVIRGGAYAEPDTERGLLVRATRNKWIGDHRMSRDGYLHSWRRELGRIGTGIPTKTDAPKAAAQQGFRIARSGN